MYKTIDSQHLKLSRENEWVCRWNYYTIPNSNLLQISFSDMPVIEAFLTLSFLYQYQCQWSKSETTVQCFVCNSISVFRFDLLHRRKCILTHVCVSKHRVHFQCYILQIGKFIFAEFIALSSLRQVCSSRQRIPGHRKNMEVIETGVRAEGQRPAVHSNLGRLMAQHWIRINRTALQFEKATALSRKKYQ